MHCFIRKPLMKSQKTLPVTALYGHARHGQDASAIRCIWGGDSCSSWDGMAGSLKGGLHFGLSGFAFWSHDVPGFHTLPNFMNSVVADDVYMRWTQFGVFSSHIRYHGTNKREPWHYPAIAPIMKKMVEITLYTYTLYYSTKSESYLKRSTSLASSDFSSP